MEINANKKVILLHITDFHFGDQMALNYSTGRVTFDQIAKLIIAELSTYEPTDLIVAVGGDIADKADAYHYQTAKKFFNQLGEAFTDIPVTYIATPGNHDINIKAANKFGDFNKFARELTENHEFVYSHEHTAGMVEMHGWSFITTNTAFKEDTKRSKIYPAHLEEKLLAAKNPIVLLLHHHLIPMYQNDNSLVSNALDLFKLALKSNVKILLHGHVHSSVRIYIGDGTKQIPVIGCGALLPRLSDGYLNQFNIFNLKIDGAFEVIPYAITNEAPNEVGPSLIKQYLD
jgi:3',5'-cyclic AMP phosphodiesterase CpdA